MKKKIALLLALIMTISLMPITIFAGSSNRLTNYYNDVAHATLAIGGGTNVSFPKRTPYTGGSTDRGEYRSFASDRQRRGNLGAVYEASFLVLTMDDSGTGGKFRLNLDNANNPGENKPIWTLWATHRDTTYDINTANPFAGTTLTGLSAFKDYSAGLYSTVSAGSAAGSIYSNGTIGYIVDANDNPWFKYKYAPGAGYWTSSDKKVSGEPVLGKYGGNVSFDFEISSYDLSTATVTINGTYKAGDIIAIPMAIVVSESNVSAKVEVVNISSRVSNSSHIVVNTVGGGTTNYAADTSRSGRDEIELSTITFKETRSDSIGGQGTFEIVAPSGYEFVDNPSNWSWSWKGAPLNTSLKDYPNNTVIAYTESSKRDENTSYYIMLRHNSGSGNMGDSQALTIDGIKIRPIDGDSVTRSDLYLTVNRIQVSRREVYRNWTNGNHAYHRDNVYVTITTEAGNTAASYVGDPDVWSTTYNAGPPATTTVRTYAPDTDPGNTSHLGVTAGTILVAKSVVEGIKFTAAAATTITAGRYDDVRINNSTEHVSAAITIEELAPGSWRTSRNTTLTLPEGVKIRGIKFTGSTNLFDDNTSQATDARTTLDILDSSVGMGLGYIETTNKSSFTNGDKYDSVGNLIGDTQYGTVRVSGNSVTISNITDVLKDSKGDEKAASLTFVLYLSVSPEYNKETIEVEISGNAIASEVLDKNLDETDKVEIAKVQQPIKISAETQSVEVGFSSVVVSKITIEEKFAGALLKNEELIIGMSDDSGYNYLRFASIARSQVEIAVGDIDITRRTSSDGTIVLSVESASRTASTIILHDVEIINRAAIRGTYDLVVYGDAVFANYERDLEKDTNGVVVEGVNSIVGFGEVSNGFRLANFLEIVPEGGKVVVPSLKSKVTLNPNSKTIYIDGKYTPISEAPSYFDPKKIDRAVADTLYVPVRLVLEPLGVQVYWDEDTKTATLIAEGNTAKLTYGNTNMIVNGVAIPMTTVDGVPVCPIEGTPNRMYLPIRAVFEAFGCTVDFDLATNTAIIN